MSSRSRGGLGGLFAGLVVLVLVALVTSKFGCTDEATARRVLEQNGYTEIEITGWRPWMKSESDTLSTGFRAKGPNGQVVSGAVTGGWTKGATIRFD